MCLYIYLVTDANLPELRWDKRQPAFNVHHLKRKEKFLRNLAGANAYILGSHEGCGCGFILDELGDPQDQAAEDSRRRLCEYVDGSFAAKPALSCLQPGRETRASPPSVPG